MDLILIYVDLIDRYYYNYKILLSVSNNFKKNCSSPPIFSYISFIRYHNFSTLVISAIIYANKTEMF